MFIPFTLIFYISRVFLLHISVITFAVGILCFLGASAETARRLFARDITSGDLIAKMAFLQTPALIEMAFPFIFLIAAMSCFFSLTRHHELNAARTSGISAWVFLSPALIIALLSGIFIFAVYNPASTVLNTNYNKMKMQYIKRKASLLTIADTGIWLKQGDQQQQSIIHATQVSQKGVKLSNVTIFLYEDKDRFVGRLDAKSAELKTGRWELHDVWITPAEGTAHFTKRYQQKTPLTPEHIYDSVAPPQTIAFWNLGRFITLAKAAGLSVALYEFQWHTLATMPLLLVAMVFVGASATFFSSARQGREIWLIIASLAFGFVIYTLIFLGRKLAASVDAPIILSVWTPIIFALSSGLFLFLQKEEG